MFERYTEKARRVIFFARYEASQVGSPYIETEHLLLGLLREDPGLLRRLVPNLDHQTVRAQIEKQTLKREFIPTSVDLPLNNESKRVLAYAAEEAEAAQILQELGAKLEDLRHQIARHPHNSSISLSTSQITAGRALPHLADMVELHGVRRRLESASNCSKTPRDFLVLGEAGMEISRHRSFMQEWCLLF